MFVKDFLECLTPQWYCLILISLCIYMWQLEISDECIYSCVIPWSVSHVASTFPCQNEFCIVNKLRICTLCFNVQVFRSLKCVQFVKLSCEISLLKTKEKDQEMKNCSFQRGRQHCTKMYTGEATAQKGISEKPIYLGKETWFYQLLGKCQ